MCIPQSYKRTVARFLLTVTAMAALGSAGFPVLLTIFWLFGGGNGDLSAVLFKLAGGSTILFLVGYFALLYADSKGYKVD